jgi:hypothetical protein
MSTAESAPLRILHAPRNIAGQGSDIVAALRRLGHHAELWEDVPDVFGRPSDRVLDLDRSDGRPTWEAVQEAADRFDVVHFHFGHTFVPRNGVLPPYWDLPLLRSLGLRVYFTFHGSDMPRGTGIRGAGARRRPGRGAARRALPGAAEAGSGPGDAGLDVDEAGSSHRDA